MSDTLSRLSAALADRYRIERELGAGGMATVYLAHDLKHERDVAIKVLHPDLGAALGGERFLSEIKTTAKLQHPHILPLLDSGTADGLLFYVMPLARGETLRDRLKRERVLGIDETVRIIDALARALDVAHRQGIVHRDLKPENILLHEGEPLLADFGIALAVSEAGGDRLTQTGLSLGTPSYMSPEQASGERAIDARSDIYSLGALAYEMLAGEPPVTGPTPRAMIAKLLTGTVTPLRVLREAVPAAMEAAVMRALAKEPADRPATAGELAATMRAGTTTETTAPQAIPVTTKQPSTLRSRRGLLFAIGGAAVLALLVWGALRGRSRAAMSSGSSIAVLPFTEQNAPNGEFLGDGIAETLIFALNRVPGLKVAARTSAFSFKGKDVELTTIGDKLGVETVLSGSVQRSGGRLRVTVRLERVSDHSEVWTEQYDRDAKDVFALQDEVAKAVVTRLAVGNARSTVVQAGTTNPDAYQEYLQGRFLLARRGSGLAAAIPHFMRAAQLDPEYANAWAGLALCYSLQHLYAQAPDEVVVPGYRNAMARATALDSNAVVVVAARAFWKHTYEFDWDGAEAGFKRAIAIDSTDTQVRVWYANFLSMLRGDPRAAAVHAAAAYRLDSLSGYVTVQQVLGLTDINSATERLRLTRRAVELEPVWQNYRVLGSELANLRRFGESWAVFDSALALGGRPYWVLRDAAWAAASAGDRARSAVLDGELQRLASRPDAGTIVGAADVAARAGTYDSVFVLLERARQRHDAILAYPTALANGYPTAVRADARWRRFWESMKVDPRAAGVVNP